MDQTEITLDEFLAKAKAAFGENQDNWKFRCPSCGHVSSVADWKRVGAKEPDVGYNCVGRYEGDRKLMAANAFKKAGGPCNYTGGGLFKLNPMHVKFPDGHVESFFELAL